MRMSMISAALVAALVGFGASVSIVLAAAQALGATPAQTASWLAAVSIAKGLGMILLSGWTRVPVVLAWSTPGAALIATTSGIGMNEAVGAFLFAALLIVLTALLPPIRRAVSAIPDGVAAAMLAGVLLPFCMAAARYAGTDPAFALPIIAMFLAMRLIQPLTAALAALALGLILGFALSPAQPPAFDIALNPFVFVLPEVSVPVLLGLGLPLYLVTMASQNLPGFAVLRANGYEPPVGRALGVTGLGSALSALFGAHTHSMAAITAAICLGPDVHPDKDERWKVGLIQGVIWIALGFLGPYFTSVMLALPASIIGTVAGLALILPFLGAVQTAFTPEHTRFAAAVTLITTASGVAAFGIGAAFWGLVAGVVITLADRLRR
ncbi:benzoate transporter BenE [Roseovarius faecimaris]|uniref:Benzoate transporter BenE n=1 Tax=Roseovarius faecimaris TaxID=2494550 RepID=A0A6I6IKB1_9RHOB|nr:benzoate/H(+) symporter BenE family transporter [Roseovarius faecimaris]QGX97430.1 benzoate transporter BenE [Roseovarius faecimaris]